MGLRFHKVLVSGVSGGWCLEAEGPDGPRTKVSRESVFEQKVKIWLSFSTYVRRLVPRVSRGCKGSDRVRTAYFEAPDKIVSGKSALKPTLTWSKVTFPPKAPKLYIERENGDFIFSKLEAWFSSNSRARLRF